METESTRTTYIVTRLLLLMIAGVCVLAIFAIFRIERSGSPVGAPALTRVFSPDGNGFRDAAVLTFRVQQPVHVDVWITRSESSSRVARLASNRRVSGAVRMTWDGRIDNARRASTGSFRAHIHVRELRRTFPVTRATTIDLIAPQITEVSLTRGPERGFATLTWTCDADSVGRRVELDGRRIRIRRVTTTRTANGLLRYRLLLELGTIYSFDRLASSGQLTVRDAAGNVSTTSVQR